MPKRVLLLGTTGVNKKVAMEKLVEYRSHRYDVSDLITIDFEDRFIGPDLHIYLDESERTQRSMWREAWEKCSSLLQSKWMRDKDVVLAMHGTLTRPLYGNRSPMYINDLREFKATAIVTLIDDVYTQWYRTKLQAKELRWKGEPTLYQLLEVRHAEMFLGDILASNIAPPDRTLRNFTIAAQHPARVFDRLVFGPQHPRTVYLSFPIAGPRARLSRGDPSGIKEINDFLKHADRFERENGGFVFFCPLTIDELPLVAQLMKKGKKEEFITFNRRNRWDVREFYAYAPDEPLLTNPDALPETLAIPRKEVENAKAMIEADVPIRDYRLVLQSRCLAVYNPWFGNVRAGGVDNEISCALHHRIPVHIFQERHHDSHDQARKFLLRIAMGALGERELDKYITFYDTMEELFNGVKQGF